MFLHRLITATDSKYAVKERWLCGFFLSIMLLDYRFIRLPPSMVAAVSMFSARRMLGSSWEDEFVYYSRFAAEQLTPAADVLQSKLLAADPAEYIWRKYDWCTNTHAREWTTATREGNTEAAETAASQYAGLMRLVERKLRPLF